LKNSIKIILSLTVLFLVLNISFVYSQKMVICNDIDRQGKCSGETKEYQMADSTGPIMCVGIFADSAKTLGTEGIVIKVYKITDGKEVKFGSDFIKETKKDWIYCWRRILFWEKGSYIVKAYDQDEKVMCTADFTLTSKLDSPAK
jgi:hypothetical protein